MAYSPHLSDSDIVFYGKLTGYTVKYGYCDAGNEYLADKFSISIPTVTRRIARLEKHGFITVEFIKTQEGTERKIWLNCAVNAPKPKPASKPKKQPAKKAPKPLSNLEIYPDQLNVEAWHNWLEYRRDELRFSFKTAKSETTAINKLIKDSNGDWQLQADMIEASIANGYKGIFKPKQQRPTGQATTHMSLAGQATQQACSNILDEMFGGQA
ncbi:helix-turn-helix domain-containing protein [Endozoicomonas sp. Mp262]|uniref:helix-turn-helix domain-containing protein n=1 Tax=Endozoicomonas sp. Mp262 TaxID=2919499 RepID=UPI0021D7FD35